MRQQYDMYTNKISELRKQLKEKEKGSNNNNIDPSKIIRCKWVGMQKKKCHRIQTFMRIHHIVGQCFNINIHIPGMFTRAFGVQKFLVVTPNNESPLRDLQQVFNCIVVEAMPIFAEQIDGLTFWIGTMSEWNVHIFC